MTLRAIHIYILSLALICGALLFTSAAPLRAQSTNGNVSGYAWSSNTGWISFNCIDQGVCGTSPYWVNVTPDTNQQSATFSGYAWSPAIGWISFNAADAASCGATARLDYTSKEVTGWARAIAGGTAQSGGWDGCINLHESTSQSTYTVAFDDIQKELYGFAWGATNVGWIGFTDVKLDLTIGANQGTGAYFTFRVNGSTQTAAINSGDGVTLSWETKDIKSCTISGDLNQTFTGANVANTPPPHSYAISNITSPKSYTMTCTDNANVTLNPQTVTVTIKPAACEVIPDKVVISAGTGPVNSVALFGAQWVNTTGFPQVNFGIGNPTPGGFGISTSFTSQFGGNGNSFTTSATTPVRIAVTSTSPITTTQIIPISGSSSTGPVSTCTPAALYIVPTGFCQDPLATNVGQALPCKYGVNTSPNTKRPPWEEI